MQVIEKIYQNEKGLNWEILTIVDNDEIWFKGKDIATILEYKDTRTAIIDHVEENDKKSYEILSSGKKPLPQKMDKKTIFINESGLYSLILGSKKKEAKRFKKWVTSEVLPSIRKTGQYEIIKQDNNTKLSQYLKKLREIKKLSNNDDELENLLISELKEEIKAAKPIKEESKTIKYINEDDRPKHHCNDSQGWLYRE